MFPDNQNQNGGQSGYGAGSAPVTPQNPAHQPNQNGQYEVVPPLPGGQNNGHTGHNPYEFIMNPETPKHGGGIRLSGSNFIMRIAFLVGGAVVLMIIAAVILSALGPKSNTADLIAIAQRQQEIIRVATAAGEQASGQDTKNFVATVALSVTSDQQQILSNLLSSGKKVAPKTLALDQSSQTDTTLSNAASAGTYDSAVVTNLRTQLQTYETLLQKAFKDTSKTKTKALIQTTFKNADALTTQAKSLSSAN